MSSLEKENILDKKFNDYRFCWFCARKCTDFIAICDNCKTEKLKNIKQPRTYIKKIKKFKVFF
jgi:hypothetical protein